ncbi:MAG: glycosyltransferase, partial [Chloroflexi bacterium]|nr:glycosyltransferase [Chloroflexota bacterium]
MKLVILGHSIVSDWNHGNAHFLRGLARALHGLGHQVVFYEEEDNWSISNLVRDHGREPIHEFSSRFPFIEHRAYRMPGPDRIEAWLEAVVDGADACLVHEWNHPELVRAAGRLGGRNPGPAMLYHDTHHRAYTEPGTVRSLGLERYDAVLAFGPGLAEHYRQAYGLDNVVVFHEGADVDLFRPLERPKTADVVFIGNWGDEDRRRETVDFFLEPARALPQRRFALYGVRYPADLLKGLAATYGVEHRGWMPNYRAPEAYAESTLTLHVIRRQYAERLHGTPTIRLFEALACGICLVSTPWPDTDHLFEAGSDYALAASRQE